MKAEPVTDAVAVHGEGPVWDGNSLHFVDMLAGDVLSLAATANGVDRWHVGDVVAALRPRQRGGVVLATARGFAVADRLGAEPRDVAEAFTASDVRMNEGSCDPQGRFYAGTMAYDARKGGGALYRLDLDGSVHVVLDSVTISNGLVWSLDGSTVYYIDTPTQRVDAFDFDPASGDLSNRRPFVRIPSDVGSPDGMTIDEQGGLWVALFGGSAVHRYNGAGVLDEVIELPVRQVTACAFGGPSRDQLYITTSRHSVADPEPEAGALFRADAGVRGVPVHPYAA